jgi:chromate transporter
VSTIIASPSSRDPDGPSRVGSLELFLLFSRLGLSSFGGGVSAWMHRAFVEQRRWLSEAEFAAAFAVAQFVPGVNVVNLAVLIGHRTGGTAGAAAAVLGLLVGPSLAVIGLAVVYDRFAATPTVSAALEGATAAAVGLVVAMGVQTGRRLVRDKSGCRAGSLAAVAISAATFALVGLLRLPTVPAVLCLAPLAIALAHLARKRSTGGPG